MADIAYIKASNKANIKKIRPNKCLKDDLPNRNIKQTNPNQTLNKPSFLYLNKDVINHICLCLDLNSLNKLYCINKVLRLLITDNKILYNRLRAYKLKCICQNIRKYTYFKTYETNDKMIYDLDFNKHDIINYCPKSKRKQITELIALKVIKIKLSVSYKGHIVVYYNKYKQLINKNKLNYFDVSKCVYDFIYFVVNDIV